MGIGILEVKENEIVSGTSYILGEHLHHGQATNNIQQQSSPKLVTKSSTAIKPVPQPSNDPNDPLNWPLWQRDLMFGILCLMSALAVSCGSNIAQDIVLLAGYFKVSNGDAALLTACLSLGCGVTGAVVVPAARVLGHRPLYLMGAAVIFASTVWAGQSGTYSHLLWARVLQGVGTAPFEALMSVTVSDLYFVHQRGMRMSVLNLFLVGSGFFSPVIGGWITHGLSWRWIFHLLAIVTGMILVLMFLFAPETTYHRMETDKYVKHARTDTDLETGPRSVLDHSSESSTSVLQDTNACEKHGIPQDLKTARGIISSTHSGDTFQAPLTRKPFIKRLALYRIHRTQGFFPLLIFKLFIRPFLLLLHPPTLWMTILMGTSVAWPAFTGVVLAISFPLPPLSFNELQVGYMYFAALIGALLGFLLCFLSSDHILTFLSKRNRGVYEPEFRIFIVIPQLLLGFTGLYGFGVATDNLQRYGWFWPAFFFACQTASMVCGCVASSAYIVDGYSDIAVEAFTLFIIFKNLFLYLLSAKAVDWILAVGPLKLFSILAGIQVAICASSLPLYIVGKRLRLWLSKCRLFSF